MRQGRHECNTSETRPTQVQQACKTNHTSATQVQNECYMNETSATRVRNFDFDNDTNENIFSHPYITYMANERLQGGEQFHFKN